MKKIQLLSISFLLGAMMLTGLAGNAFALTPACDPVTNLATLSYSVGGSVQTPIGSSETGNTAGAGTATSFFVDSKVDLSMAIVTPVVNATGLNNVMRFDITNEGNDTQRYQLQLYAGDGETANTHLDNFDMDDTNIRIVIDPDADGTLDSTINATTGAVTAVGNEILLTSTAADDGTDLGLTPDVDGDVSGGSNVIHVYVIADVPDGQSTDDAAHYSLKARTYQVAGATDTTGGTGGETGNTATDGNTAPSGGCAGGQVVLADGDANGTFTPVGAPTDVSDGANDGDFFATGTFRVRAAIISVEKDVAYLWDPVNGGGVNARPIPLGYVQYTITISNTGAAPATLTTLSDPLATSLALDPDFIDGTAAAGAAPGAAQGGANTAVYIYTTGSTRAIDLTDTPVYLQPDAADPTVNGVAYSGNPGGTLSFDFATLLPIEAGYTDDGDLNGGEEIVIQFNAIIQ